MEGEFNNYLLKKNETVKKYMKRENRKEKERLLINCKQQKQLLKGGESERGRCKAMALSASDLPAMFSLLSNSLSSDDSVRKPAEAALSQSEARPGFCSCLMVCSRFLSPSLYSRVLGLEMWHAILFVDISDNRLLCRKL